MTRRGMSSGGAQPLVAVASADLHWYQRISEKRKLPLCCPIAAIDKCPRYMLSLQHASAGGALDINIDSELVVKLRQKWKTAESFVVEDRSVGTSFGPGNKLRGVAGFCPEIAAQLFGEYCTDLRPFPDDDARTAYTRVLNDERTCENDPRRIWMVYSPRHFSECTEFSSQGGQLVSDRPLPKARKGISPRLRFQIFARDGYRCIYCGATGDVAALHVDHRTSIADGGSDDPENLATACERCNLGKGAASAVSDKGLAK